MNNSVNKENSFFEMCKNKTLTDNPILVQLLGICPLLALTDKVLSALAVGVVFFAVTVITSLIISLLGKFIPKAVRISVYIIITAGLTTAAETAVAALYPQLHTELSVFLALIAVNAIIITRLEFAEKNTFFKVFADSSITSAVVLVVLVMTAFIREPLGNGTLFGVSLFGDGVKPVGILATPVGAVFILGCIAAVIQKVKFVHVNKVLDISVQTKKQNEGADFESDVKIADIELELVNSEPENMADISETNTDEGQIDDD